MPIYEFEDSRGNRVEQFFSRWQDCPESIVLDGVVFEFCISAPAISPDPYWSGVYDISMGQYFTSRDKMRDEEKRRGLRPAETTREEQQRVRDIREQRRAKADKKIEQVVGQVVQEHVI